MLQTIEVEIDASGRIHPLEPLSFMPTGRAYLTLLPSGQGAEVGEQGSAAKALELLASPRFAKRPSADPAEVQARIEALRNDWNER
ncbi:MAG TPA: hypothetical protein VJ001_11005 [Rhodocyclaceae bacterium]|nr:hypothetical protein [Rhodocyclaceae bacterium]